MSHVDNVLLSFSVLEEDGSEEGSYALVDAINEWLREHAWGQQFGPDLGSLGDAYGGSKWLETPLFLAAFNYLPEEEFVRFLRGLPWCEPKHAQLLIKRQHDESFVVVSLHAD